MDIELSDIIKRIIMTGATLAILGLFFWIVAKRSRLTDFRQKKPQKRVTLTAHLAPAAIIKTLTDALPFSGYKLEEASEDFIRVSDAASATSWGFYYPIYLKPLGTRETELEIGIQSKAMQMGPVVTKQHQKLIEAVKRALSI